MWLYFSNNLMVLCFIGNCYHLSWIMTAAHLPLPAPFLPSLFSFHPPSLSSPLHPATSFSSLPFLSASQQRICLERERERGKPSVEWICSCSSPPILLFCLLSSFILIWQQRTTGTQCWLHTELKCQEQSRTMLVSIYNTAKQPTPTSCEHSDTQLFYELTSQLRIDNKLTVNGPHLLSMQLLVINKLFTL